MSKYSEKKVKSLNTFLNKWIGGDVIILEISRSHTSLCMLITNNKKEGNLYIKCLEPIFISGAKEWKNFSPNISSLEFKDESKGKFILFDNNSNFVCICDDISIFENIKNY